MGTHVSLGSALLAVGSSLSITQHIHAQHCGTEVPLDGIEIVENRMALGLYDLPPGFGRDPVTVRIKWHVVTSSVGNRCISDVTLANYLERLSAAFEPTGMSFCADAHVHLIVDDELFANVQSHYSLRMIEPTENAIDIYWCPSLQDGALCGTSSYSFGPPIQGIAMQTSCMGHADVIGVLAHEVGHYFDLLHTHEMGWGIECPVGGDCETQGDLVCDTTPGNSLMFDSCVNATDCSFSQNDSCLDGPPPPICDGSPYMIPELRNYMSYSVIPCLTEFTIGQLRRARASFNNFRPELHAVDCVEISPCIADLDNNGVVNGSDLAILLNEWGGSDSDADLNRDGLVTGADLPIFLASWNTCN